MEKDNFEKRLSDTSENTPRIEIIRNIENNGEKIPADTELENTAVLFEYLDEKASKINELEENIKEKLSVQKEFSVTELNKKKEALHRYHQNLKFESEHYLKDQTKNIIGQLAEAYAGHKKMLGIINFIGQHDGNNIAELKQAVLENKDSNRQLEGITEIELLTLDGGKPAYMVSIHKKYWSLPAYGPGVAMGGPNVIFVIDGFSKQSVQLIKEHEIYHLNNPEASEFKTVWNASIKRNAIGSAIVVLESLIHYPQWMISSFRNFIKDRKNLSNS